MMRGFPPEPYCVVSQAGRYAVRVTGAASSVRARLVALADGRAVAVSPPHGGVTGSITIVPPHGKPEVHTLRLDALPEDARDLVTHGSWLDGISEQDSAHLGAWVSGSSAFVGVNVALDGTVIAGTVHRGIERASIAGPFALALDEQGGGYETTNGGATWFEISVPAEAVSASATLGHERGCTAVGCSVGSWVRIGWGGGRSAPDLVPAEAPKLAKLDPAPIVTWGFDCSPSGEYEVPSPSPLARASRPEARSTKALVAGELQSSAFRPFLGMPSPTRAPLDLGFDFGTEDHPVQVRGYAWGSRDGAWDRDGTWLVRVADRFAVRNAIWSTAPSRSPWADAAAAAEVFGSEPSHRTSNEWRDGARSVGRRRGAGDAYGKRRALAVVEKNRAIGLVRKSDEFPIDRSPASSESGEAGTSVPSPGPRAFQILRVDGGTCRWSGRTRAFRTKAPMPDGSFVRPVATRSASGSSSTDSTEPGAAATRGSSIR